MTVLRGVNLLDQDGDEVFPNAKDSANRDVIRTIVSDPVQVSITDISLVDSFNAYGEILGIAGNATQEVTAYTVPADTSIQLTQVDVSSGNLANIVIKKSGSNLSQKRTWWGKFDVVYKFDSLLLSSGDTVGIEVKNNSTSSTDVYYNLQGRVVTPSQQLDNVLLLENGEPLLLENGEPLLLENG